MAITTKVVEYDHAAYITRFPVNAGVNVANTTFPLVAVAFNTGVTVYSATFQIVTAGTSSAGNNWVINRLSGTSTTALATASLTTATANSVIQVALSTATGGVQLNAGDLLQIAKGTDTVCVSAACIEASLSPYTALTA